MRWVYLPHLELLGREHCHLVFDAIDRARSCDNRLDCVRIVLITEQCVSSTLQSKPRPRASINQETKRMGRTRFECREGGEPYPASKDKPSAPSEDALAL
jgi:hypothetical protein